MPGDDLLQPSLEGVSRKRTSTARPWRLSSQSYVAFFGGPIAVAAISFINAGRLGLSQRRRIGIILSGVIGLILVVAVGSAVALPNNPEDVTTAERIAFRALGLLAFAPMYLLQREADRVYSFYDRSNDDAYESLWLPGIAAVVVGAILQFGFLSSAAGTGV